MDKIASCISPDKFFHFAKQAILLRKPAVIQNFFTGISAGVFTVFTPVKTRYFDEYLNGTG
jgi:hypothetical protein